MQMTIEMATLVASILILVGAIIAGGIIYAGLQKVADAINKQT
jgi:Flp pilus assembly protein TadG